jgi:hypothetical protein
MVPLGDEARVEAHFGPFKDSANLDARSVPGLRRTYHRLGNHFGCTRWNCSVMWVMWNLTSFCSEIVLVSVQHRCIVCTKRTIGSEIILDAPDGTLRWRGSNESSVCLEIVLILLQERCMVCVECTIGSKIVLDAPNRTPRWHGSCGISLLSIWRQC